MRELERDARTQNLVGNYCLQLFSEFQLLNRRLACFSQRHAPIDALRESSLGAP